MQLVGISFSSRCFVFLTVRLMLAKRKSGVNTSTGSMKNAKARYGEIVPRTTHTGKNPSGMAADIRSRRARVLGRFKSLLSSEQIRADSLSEVHTIAGSSILRYPFSACIVALTPIGKVIIGSVWPKSMFTITGKS